MSDLFIPPKTLEALANEHPVGTRHRACIDIALPLAGNGLPPAAIVATLKSKFPHATEKNLWKIVDWCVSRNPTPSGNGHSASTQPPRNRFDPLATPKQKPVPATLAAKAFINGSNRELKSPVSIPETGHAELLFRTLYDPTDYLNIVCKFTTSETKGKVKANPSGAGKTLLRDEWLSFFEKSGVPFSEAGAWMRPNPVLKHGTGKDGAITNSDVAAFRYLLLESDEIPVEHQLAIYERLALPLGAILTSGGQSVHAWLRVDCETSDDYALFATRILDALQPLGFDQANKNPSRLSRLPGVIRKIGAHGNGSQRLLYLAPDVPPLTEDELSALELRVQPPKFRCKPMHEAVLDALEIYTEIAANKSKTGLRTGFPKFDFLTGGLKKGWLIVVAGETNSGKTTYVLNIVMNALRAGKGVVLFSFEMDQQEIIDIIFAREAEINRNKFNNGYFGKDDFKNMTDASDSMAKFPLYTYDNSLMTIKDVEEAATREAVEHGISLVVIDYLQLANSENFRDSREQQVAYISRMSKALAKNLKVPVIAVSQLNEEGKVRESRAIAHDANCVIKLCEKEDRSIDAKIIKGRSIPKGSFFFHFERELCRFTEIGCDSNLEKLLPKEEQDEISI